MKISTQISVLAILACLTGATTRAEKRPLAPSVPLPSQLSNAKTIFLSNACEDDNRSCREIYNQIYAGLTSNHRFELTASPQNDDLLLEFHFPLQAGKDWRTLRLIILDPQTHAILWSLNEDARHADPGSAVQQILTDFFALTSRGADTDPTQAEPKP
jgi:hypothetical protein